MKNFIGFIGAFTDSLLNLRLLTATTLICWVLNLSVAQICVDGNYCPNPDFPGGVNCVGEAVDEWGMAATSGPLSTSSSSTCHVQEIFGYADDENLYLGISVGNQGTAFFYVYFDVDCDTTNHDQCHNGADFRIKFRIKNNGVIEAFELQEYSGPDPSTNSTMSYCLNDATGSNGIGGLYTLSTSSSVVAFKGFIDGCSASNNSWVEISFAIVSVFDVCDPSSGCTGVGITAITSQEGGAEASNDCESFPVAVPIAVNGPPTAVVDPIPPCIYSDANVCFDGSNSSDPDNNIQDYEWDFDYDGITFDIDTTGIMVCHMYPAGNYTAALRVVDSFGCADTAVTGAVDFMVVDASNKVNASCVNGSVTCPGNNDGTVSVVASGGTQGYTYLWSSGGTMASESGLGIGDYTVTVTDLNGCTDTCTATISAPDAIIASCMTNHTNATLDCKGDMDGSVTVTSTGGTPNYSYMWSNLATTSTITGLGAGTFTVTITDMNGCTATCGSTISEPPLLVANCATNHANDQLDCHGDTDGSVSVVAGGGTPGYTYVWSNTATTNSITGLGVGTYTVTVTDSKGCTASCNKTITQPTPVTATCNSVPANGLLDCHGDTDGGVSVVAGGGTAGYTYAWSNAATTNSITGLGAGTYTVTVTDSKGCTASCSKTISQPTPVTAICNSVPANGLLDCHGDSDGSVSVVAGGGTPGYTYVWGNAATTNSITGLGAGTYIVTVTDSKGCTVTCSKTITQPILLACSIIGTDVGCNTTNTGSADASVTGGTMPYTYLWSNGATTQDITGLSVGGYTLSVTDANNCLSTCDVNIGGFVCSIAPTVCDINNLRGAVSTVTGGTPPYTYLWSTGETTSTIQGLIPGIYDLLVSDAQECETQCQVVIDRCITCDGICGTTFARLDGYEQCFDQFGFSQWGWTNGVLGQGNYTFDLYSEALLCDLNNGVLVGELLIDYGLDTVIVTYNLFGDYTMSLSSLYIGCTDVPNNNGAQTVSPSQYPYQQFHDDVTTYTYVVDISNLVCEGIYVIAHAETCLPNDFSCSITGTSVDCNGGSTGMADATVTGGMPPYRYLWSNGQTTEDISGLTAGLYTLNATDENNCLTVCEVRITYPSMPAPQIGPFCQNDAPYDLSDLLTDPNLMGSWIGSGVSNDIFYPSALTVGMHDIYYEDEINCVSAMISIFVDERCCPPDYSEANDRKLIGLQSHAVHYETDGILDSDQVINANTIYDSGLQINLQPEFEVKLGSEFSALIDGCP